MHIHNNKKDMLFKRHFQFATLAFAAVAAAPTMATEGGGSIYNHGIENFVIGAVPPPGTYFLLYGSHYRADTLRDNNGDKLPVDFKVEASAIAPRVAWVSDMQFLGGQFAFHAIAPLVDVSIEAGPFSQSKSGLGDITFGPTLGYHVSQKFHYAVGLDITAPTGRYDKDDLANIGRNYWNFQPVLSLTYMQPQGFNADLKLMYDFNARNKDTDYRSGQELHADYALGWGFGNGWTAGVAGYVYQQTTSDKQGGNTVADNRGRAMSIGPSVKYDGGDWFMTVKYEEEFGVRNRAEGGGLKVKVALPF